MKTIFIIGQHRTGSTLLKNMLDAHSEVSMAFDETNLFEPYRKNTLDQLLNNKITSVNDLIQHIEEKEVYGTFWKEFERSGISFQELEKELNTYEELKSKTVLKSVLDLLRRKYNTSYSGIKYPLHISKAGLLKKWFPISKVIFLTRNPKAIIASKLNDPASKKRKEKSFLHRFAIHYFTLFYFASEYRKSVTIYFSNQNHFHLVTYESLITKKEAILKKICNYFGINFEAEMLDVGGKESSFHQNEKSVPHQKSLEKYKEVLNNFDSMLISILTKRSYNKIKNEPSADL